MCIKNDGNAIKPSTEFDARLKKGVGLNIDVDIDFVKSNEVTEVLTSYMYLWILCEKNCLQGTYSQLHEHVRKPLWRLPVKNVCVWGKCNWQGHVKPFAVLASLQ